MKSFHSSYCILKAKSTPLQKVQAILTFSKKVTVGLHQWKCQPLSRVQLFVTPWTAAHQAPLSMEFSRQEYWSGLPFPAQGIFPTQGWNLPQGSKRKGVREGLEKLPSAP